LPVDRQILSSSGEVSLSFVSQGECRWVQRRFVTEITQRLPV